MFIITSSIHIPWHELQFQTMRAQGAGGQHVNKTDSAVWLRFNYRACVHLTPLYKEGLDKLSDSRIHDGYILIRAQSHRSQGLNRKEAVLRLRELLLQAAWRPTQRRATQPSRSARTKRIEAKKHQAQIKANRSKLRLP